MSALTITHNADQGTLVTGTARGDASRTVLRTYGLKWSGQLGAWYVPKSRARAADHQLVDALAEALRTAGFTVDVQLAVVSVADAEQTRARLSADRADRLRVRAQRLRGEAEGHAAAAHRVMDAIPPGQPILTGHHSERRHRRDLTRADRAISNAVAAGAAADAAQRGAQVAEREQERRHELPAIGRRLDRLRADAAAVERRINGTASPLSGPATGDYLQRLLTRARELAEAISYWEAQEAELVGAGEARAWSKDDFVVGDRIRTVRGMTATVRRVNAKTLRVHYDVMPAAITNPVRYYDVADRLARDEDASSS